MMRSALESRSEDTTRECIASAKSLIDCLRHTKDTINWDLAEICLGQCETIVNQMSECNHLAFQTCRQANGNTRNNARGSHGAKRGENRPGVAGSGPDIAPAGSSREKALYESYSGPMNGEVFSSNCDTGSPSDGIPNHDTQAQDYMLEDYFFSDLWQTTYLDVM